jgi:endo-1,4-beta-xylanase
MLPLSRRRFLGMSAAALAGMRLSARAEETPNPALRDLAAAAGLLYGSDSDSEIAQEPAAYGDLFARECALYAAYFSWKMMQPQPGLGAPAHQDSNIAFARAHQIRLTGGHLLWHESDPDWLKTLDRAAMEKAVQERIAEIGRLYAPLCYSWNVVNEALHPSEGRPDGLRETLYVKTMGPDFFDLAFHAAQAAAPGVLRVYNDYGIEMDDAGSLEKRAALLKLLDRWIAQGTPVDAVGIQSHLRIDNKKFDAAKVRAFLKEIATRGLKILITELDVYDQTTPADTPTRDRAVADFYTRYLDVVLDEPAVKAVITWGLSDRYSWQNSPYFKDIFNRPDHLPARGLPFDDQLRPKPAYYALREALQHAPKRS